METKIVQINEIAASEILEKFTGIENQIKELREYLKPAPPPDDYLSRKDICKIFKISMGTVHQWTRRKFFIMYKIGHKVYYKRAEVEAALTAKGKIRHANK